MTKQEIIDKHRPMVEYPSYYHESSIKQMMEQYANEKVDKERDKWVNSKDVCLSCNAEVNPILCKNCFE